MEVHAVRQPRRTRLTGCHLAPLPPLPHPVLHSFPLGTPPTGLHNPAALRRCLRLRHTPPRVLSPRSNRLRRLFLGPFRPRGDSRERLRYQLAGVSPFRRSSIAPRGCPPVRLQGLREQLADVSRAGHCRLLRCIPRLFPRRRLSMGAAPCFPRVRGGPPPSTTSSGPVGTTGGAPRGTAGSGTWTVRRGDPAAVSPDWGTARGGAAAGAPILLASPGGTPRASPCDNPCRWAPRPGSGTGTGTGTGIVC